MPTGRSEDVSRPVAFLATESHWLDHLAPVWRAATNRGPFWVPAHLAARATAAGVEPEVLPADLTPDASQRGPMAVASYGDLRRIARQNRHIILFEHGAGFSFSRYWPSYAGGLKWRCLVSVFVCPNEFAARRNRAAYRDAVVRVVGCPKLDAWHVDPPRPQNAEPVVALAWHWDCRVCPETRSAYAHFADAVPELARRFHVLAHAHPRWDGDMRAAMERAGCEWAPDFDDVMARADLLVNDASSVLYEFASTGRPVVVLNAPWYRRDVQHGLRFWEHANVGINCGDAPFLADTVAWALEDPEEQRMMREVAIEDVYPVMDGTAAQKAAAIVDALPQVLDRRAAPLRPARPRAITTAKKAGVLYVAMGDTAKASAERSATSLRVWHELPVAVVSDTPQAWAEQTIRRPDDDLTARSWKTRAFELSPFDMTLLLDADTEVVGDLTHGFNALAAGWEMAVAQDYAPTLADARDRFSVREGQETAKVWGTQHVTYLNSGVVFFRKTAGVAAFFEAWCAEWQRYGGYDQMAFLRAFRLAPVKLWLLATAWNTHDSAFAAHVWHQHHTVERVDAGKTAGPRGRGRARTPQRGQTPPEGGPARPRRVGAVS